MKGMQIVMTADSRSGRTSNRNAPQWVANTLILRAWRQVKIVGLRVQALVILSGVCAVLSFGQTVSFEVVPPTWITPDGAPEHRGEREGSGPPRAFIFPSLGPHEEVSTSPPIPLLTNFFGQHNRFRSAVFRWSSGSGQIELAVDRRKDDSDARVAITPASETLIRRLSWEGFENLQAAFVDWLFDHTNCGFFTSCESRYTSEFNHHLITLWKSALTDGTLGEFASVNLNRPRPKGITYSGGVPGNPRHISADPYVCDKDSRRAASGRDLGER